jgi:hypothetical protein
MQTIPPVKNRPAGMTGFSIVYMRQLIPVIARQMANFALILWIYKKTSSATALGLAQVFYIVPFLANSPIARVMVDCYNRILMMMLCDIGAG